ncbi:hypothetical protein FNAPI_10413 [Fusarium napiforme]|uniref:Uncharacterized protein n=1 Tax=Fusarium napiforme TaxID=42672 RepID=A0A8H5MU60_9HYPO|nr:hypothetical protein FNAPI_10413 [Fusarium napiforme]
MLSASRDTRYPAFSNRVSDRAPALQTSNDEQLSRDQVRLWSFQEPPLTAGAPYILASSQTLQVTSDASTTPASRLSFPDQELHVLGPKFALADKQTDIHSVYPSPGHSAYAETLAHIVFTHPTIPWERSIVSASEQGSNNRMPWMGILTFTEDEMLLSKEAWTQAGFSEKDGKTGNALEPSSQGVVSLSAGEFKNNGAVATALSVDAGRIDGADYKDTDSISVILVKRETFQSIFATVDATTNKSTWTGVPDLSAFRLMAHVREAHGGLMATSTDAGNAQPQFATVVSPRTGKPGVTSPVRVTSHLISLDGLASMKLQDSQAYVGLISLYSWDWMCVPPDEVDFENVMIKLGQSVLPLRINLSPAQEAKVSNAAPASNNDGSRLAWFKETVDSGYTLKPHTLLDGTVTRALFRGPLIPALGARDMIKPFAMNAASLMLHDTTSDLDDVTYASAWNLGWAMATSDTSLTAGLLRLRGRLHAEATKRTKTKAARNGKTQISASSYIQDLEASVTGLVKAHDISQLSSHGAHKRWLRKRTDQRKYLLPTLCAVKCDVEDDSYAQELRHVTRAYFGYGPSDGSDIPKRDADSDAVLIRAWVLDKFFLASVPLHFLVPDPEMLPRESIRTFCIDPRWLGSLIDGGLSLANHFAQDDDAIRREIKNCINTYLKEVRAEGPGKGTTLQIPKWGFFLRSGAITAFPDMKIEAQLHNDTPEGVREVLYMQVLQDDILICLFDRIPGQDNFESIRISQPPHQQCFSLGRDLSKNSVHISLRPIPKSPRETIDAIDLPCTADADGKIDFYDWGSRMVRPGALAKRYVNLMETLTVEHLKSREIVLWAGSKEDVPSSIIATQLSTPILQLTLAVTKAPQTKILGDSDLAPSWTKPGATLYVSPRPLRAKEKVLNDVSETPSRPDARFTELPVGPSIGPKPITDRNKPTQHVDLSDHSIREDAIERLDYSLSLPYFPCPQNATCFPLYDPGSISGVVSAIAKPLDMVFSLRCTAAEAKMKGVYPNLLEVHIPVALSSNTYPTNTHIEARGLLTIPGTMANPTLPVVEGLNSSGLWSYSTRLVVGRLYAYDKMLEPHSRVPLQTVQSTMLVVSMIPKFDKDKMRDAFFDGSFILRRVSVIRPGSGLRDAQFDIHWHRDKSLQTVFPKLLRVRNAITIRIVEPTFYDFDTEKMMIKFEASQSLIGSSSPLEVAVIYETQAHNIKCIETLVLDPLNENSGGHISIQHSMVPLWIRLVVRAKGTGAADRWGPESSSFMIPRVSRTLMPYRGNMFYDGEQMQITWPADRHRDYEFEVTFDKGERAIKVQGSKRVANIARTTLDICSTADGLLNIHVQETLVHPRLRGVVAKGLVTLTFPWLVLSRSLDFKELPDIAPTGDLLYMPTMLPHDDWARICYWSKSGNPCLARTLCERGNVTVQLLIHGIPGYTPVETNGTLDSYIIRTTVQSVGAWRHRELDWVDVNGELYGIESEIRSFPHNETGDDEGSWSPVQPKADERNPLMGRPGVIAVAPAIDGGTRPGSSIVTFDDHLTPRKLWVGPMGEVRQSTWHSDTTNFWAGDNVILDEGSVSLGADKMKWWDGYMFTDGNRFMWRKYEGGGLAWGEIGHDDKYFSFTEDVVADADLGPDGNFCLGNCMTYNFPGEQPSEQISFVVWVKRDGSVNLARTYPRDKEHYRWESFLVAPAGSAHLASKLAAVELNACLLFWFDPTGHLVSARMTNQYDYSSFERWDYARVTLPSGEQAVTDPDSRMNIIVLKSRDVVWVGVDGKLYSFSFKKE